MKWLITVDMQNDFIDGALGTPEAVRIVPKVREAIAAFDGKLVFTRDTHETNYGETMEGRKLPVPHCIRGSEGWQISSELPTEGAVILDKPTFGCVELPEWIRSQDAQPAYIALMGLCTDICVISNAMLLKAHFPEVPIFVIEDCSAGVTPESHERALQAMEMCHIERKKLAELLAY